MTTDHVTCPETNNNKEPPAIKSMKLYSFAERIYNELRELGHSDRNAELKFDDVNKLDQYHYYGNEAIDELIKIFQISSYAQILDIGSGLGGTSRYLAHATQCHVTALELQRDLDEIARDLTSRCGLSKKVEHVCGNVLHMELGPYGNQDVITSQLVFLHISDKTALFQRCFDCLRPGGIIFIEDYYKHNELTERENDILTNDAYCDHLPYGDEYKLGLHDAGFEDIELTDVSDRCRSFVRRRAKDYLADKSRHVRVHGDVVYAEQQRFYDIMCELLATDNVGGLRIIARKPISA